MDGIIALVRDHPPVAVNLAAFLLLAAAEVGVLRAATWLVSATSLCWLVELSSTRTGFPFGFYKYHQANYADDIWLGGIPLFASLGFGSLMYFGYSAALTLLSPLRRDGSTVRRIDVPGLATAWQVLVLATVLITWMDLVMDPVTHLGRYWFLGDLYDYRPGGLHFDVPLANYGGWLLTSFVIVLVNQAVDRGLTAAGHPAAPAFDLPLRPLWSIGCQAGTYLMMLAVTVYLFFSPEVPEDVPLPGILLSGLVLTGIYAAFVATMLRHAFARPVRQVGRVGQVGQVRQVGGI
jgi:putative membrane protein